jgi:hypothetical protein
MCWESMVVPAQVGAVTGRQSLIDPVFEFVGFSLGPYRLAPAHTVDGGQRQSPNVDSAALDSLGRLERDATP